MPQAIRVTDPEAGPHSTAPCDIGRLADTDRLYTCARRGGHLSV
jgi:hypothetical protein